MDLSPPTPRSPLHRESVSVAASADSVRTTDGPAPLDTQDEVKDPKARGQRSGGDLAGTGTYKVRGR